MTASSRAVSLRHLDTSDKVPPLLLLETVGDNGSTNALPLFVSAIEDFGFVVHLPSPV